MRGEATARRILPVSFGAVVLLAVPLAVGCAPRAGGEVPDHRAFAMSPPVAVSVRPDGDGVTVTVASRLSGVASVVLEAGLEAEPEVAGAPAVVPVAPLATEMSMVGGPSSGAGLTGSTGPRLAPLTGRLRWSGAAPDRTPHVRVTWAEARGRAAASARIPIRPAPETSPAWVAFERPLGRLTEAVVVDAEASP